ncbi:DUF4232 domain-containing protein [Streptomyces sp. NBC_00038]|uniref:DUF4232 domain-containing protein n=1 Tax=Streptomyces sp. NBC_00038 TaxID=2903615 RepID=UPI002252F7EE|nr:DUF4232 domain-containing protein [Streptomyces sp. NBC_00038]MCX5559686.1 DUF4232 domain-containing protein [Streptomyces sp. NBC_00038]
MSARTTRNRMLAAAAITFATLTLAACNDGGGVREEGTSTQSPITSATPSSPSSPSDKTNEGTSTGADQAANGTTGSSGATNSTGSTGSTGSNDSNDSAPTSARCSSTTTRTTATEVSRPLNHLLLTVTNIGSGNCNLIGYPAVRFEEAQSVPPAFEDSKPQAVVTLAPGESGYASVLLSAADGSGSNGYTAKSLSVLLNNSTGDASHPSLPAKGVYVDDSIGVSYWQSTMADALTW